MKIDNQSTIVSDEAVKELDGKVKTLENKLTKNDNH